MAKYKSLLVKSDWSIAGKKRKCYHDGKHLISKGDDVLEVADGMATKGYCRSCGEAMIATALVKLSQMKASS